MRSVIRVWHLLLGRPKVTPPPQEGTITFSKLENILKRSSPAGLHLYQYSYKPGFSIHYNNTFTNTEFKSLKEFFDRYSEDGSLLSEEVHACHQTPATTPK